MSAIKTVQNPTAPGITRTGPDHTLLLRFIPEQAGQHRPVTQCRAFLDTGSDVNVIGESKVRSLGLSTKIRPTHDSHLVSISGRINIIGELDLSFSTESGPAGREQLYQSTFTVVPDRAILLSDIILGRKFIDQSLTKRLVPGRVPPEISLIDKSSEKVALVGHENLLRSKIDGLEIAGPANRSRDHDADVLFLTSQEWSDNQYDWPLKLLPGDVPDVRVMRPNRHPISKSLSLKLIWESVGLYRPIFDALLAEQESNSTIKHIPLIVVCDATGRLVLQMMVDNWEPRSDRLGPDSMVKTSPSSPLQLRLRAVIVFDFRHSRALHKALKQSRAPLSCPVTYFRPARSTFLNTAKDLLQRSMPVETSAAVLYLDVKPKRFMQYSGRDNPHYRVLLQLLRASYDPSPAISDEQKNVGVGHLGDLSHIDAPGERIVYTNSANVINASGNAVVIAYSANVINSSGVVSVGQAGAIIADGSTVVNVEDCGEVNTNGRTILNVNHAANVSTYDRTIANINEAANLKVSAHASRRSHESSIDLVLEPGDIQTTIEKEPSKPDNATAHQKSDVDTQKPAQPSDHTEGTPAAQIVSGAPFKSFIETRLHLLSLRSQAQKLTNSLHADDQTKASNGTVKILFQWEIMKFLQEDFEPGQTLEHIFVLIGTPIHPAGMTCGEYMSVTWPKVSSFLLNIIQMAFAELVKKPPSDRIYNHENATWPGLRMTEFQWNCKDEVERVTFQIWGETQLLLDTMESIAWLAAALRPTNRKHPGVSISDILGFISKSDQNATEESITFRGWLWPMEEVTFDPGPCWHSLFKSPTIVNCDYGRESVGTNNKVVGSHFSGYGIRLKLRDMTALSGAEILMEYEGAMVYFGYNTILVPIKKLGNGCLQWHLISQPTSKKMMSLASIDYDEICKGRDLSIDEAAIVDAELHYLGLWTEALIALGTADPRNYTDLRHRAYAADTKARMSESNNAGVGVNLMTGAPSLAASKSVTYAKSQTNMDYNYKKKVFLKILGDFKGQMVLIFETNPERERAWLVPKLSLVLHAAHIFFLSKKWGQNCLLNYAERIADGNAAAWEVLQPDDRWDSVRGLKPDSTPGDKKELEKLLTRIVSNMIKMDAKLVSQGPIARVHGYNLARLPSDPKFRPVHTEFGFLKSRQGWWLLTKHVPLYLVDTISPPVLPTDQLWEFVFDTLPKNHLICPMICLSTLNANEGEFPTASKISNHLYLHSPHEPFDQCTCTHCAKGGIDIDKTWRTLCLTRKSDKLRKWERMSDHPNAAVLISSRGRIFHKSPPRNHTHGDALGQHEQVEQNGEGIADDISHSEDEEEVFCDVIESPDKDADVNTEVSPMLADGQPGPSSRPKFTTNDQVLDHSTGPEEINFLPKLPSKLPSENGNMVHLNSHANPSKSKGKGKQPARDDDSSEVSDDVSASNQRPKIPTVNNNSPAPAASRGASMLHRAGSSIRKVFSKTRSKHGLKIETTG